MDNGLFNRRCGYRLEQGRLDDRLGRSGQHHLHLGWFHIRFVFVTLTQGFLMLTTIGVFNRAHQKDRGASRIRQGGLLGPCGAISGDPGTISLLSLWVAMIINGMKSRRVTTRPSRFGAPRIGRA